MFLKYICFFSISVIWLLILKIFNNLKMIAFKFYLGAIGLFIIIITFLGKYLGESINFYTSNIINLINKYLEFFYINKTFLILDSLNQGNVMVSIVAFASLIIFFPYVGLIKRGIYLMLGIIVILSINIFNIVLMNLLIKVIGQNQEMVYLIIFKSISFVMMMSLYYYTFTRLQLKNQKVGKSV